MGLRPLIDSYAADMVDIVSADPKHIPEIAPLRQCLQASSEGGGRAAPRAVGARCEPQRCAPHTQASDVHTLHISALGYGNMTALINDPATDPIGALHGGGPQGARPQQAAQANCFMVGGRAGGRWAFPVLLRLMTRSVCARGAGRGADLWLAPHFRGDQQT